jgi:hypothetical protein
LSGFFSTQSESNLPKTNGNELQSLIDDFFSSSNSEAKSSDETLSFNLNDLSIGHHTSDINIDDFSSFSLKDLIDTHLMSTETSANTKTTDDIVLSLDSLIMKDTNKHTSLVPNKTRGIPKEHQETTKSPRPINLLNPPSVQRPSKNFLKNLVNKNTQGFIHLLFEKNDGDFNSFANESFNYKRQLSLVNSKKSSLH